MSIGLTAEGGVETVRREQALVVATFDNPTPFHDKNRGGVADGGETMSDDEAGATLEQMGERLLNESFRGVIHAGGGLIQN